MDIGRFGGNRVQNVTGSPLVDIEHDTLVRLLDIGYGILVHLVLIGL